MTYPKQIVQMRPNRGLNVDLPPTEVGPEFYTAARNVHFRDGFAERTIGEVSRYAGVLTNMRNVINVITPTGQNFWVYTGEDSITAVTGLTHSDITPVGGLTARDDPNTYTTSLLNGLLVWNNGDDPPQWWDGVAANPLTELPGWIAGDRCEALRPFRNHLFALDMTEAVGGSLPDKLKWSDAAPAGAVPGSWTPAATNEAGDAQLSDTPGRIVDALPLRGSFVIYKEGSTYLCEYIGGQFVFSFRKLFVTSGVLSRNCVTEYNGRHYLISDDDIIVHDGHSIRSLMDKRTRAAIFGALDESNYQSSFVVNYEQKKEIWFCLPTAGNFFADTAVVYNLEEDAWSQRDLFDAAHGNTGIVSDVSSDNSWDADPEAWNLDITRWSTQLDNTSQQTMILALTDETTPTNSRLVEVDAGNDFDGAEINAVLQKTGMSFGDQDRFKLCKRVWPKITANAGVTVQIRVGSSQAVDDPIQWSAPVDFIQGTTRKIDTFAQGRFLAFEASSTSGIPWQLNGFDMELEERGYF